MASADIINQSLYPNSTKDTIKYSVYPGSFSTYEDIKNNHILEEFSNLGSINYNTRNKKIKDFVIIHQIAVDHTYKIDDPLLIRHILLETLEEISNDLIKNSKPYRVYFGHNMLAHFLNEDDAYCKKKHSFLIKAFEKSAIKNYNLEKHISLNLN